jgi:hypothetical protein
MPLKSIKSAATYPCPSGFNGRWAGLYRWFSGRPLNGHRYTNATGFRYGTMATDISNRANWYQFLPGYKRFLVARLPAMATPVAVAMAMLWPVATLVSVSALVAVAIWPLVAMAKTRRFRMATVEPVAKAVAKVVGHPVATGRGHGRVAIPRDFRDNPLAKIRVQLPEAWAPEPGDMARLVRVVGMKLATDTLEPTWRLSGDRPYVELAMPPAPPGLVRFADAVAMLEGLADDEVLMGLGPRSALETFSLALESPHLLIGGGSGAGKSELLAWIVGQFMRRGYGVVVLDAKFISHMWLRRVPGVQYAAESEELHDTLLWLDQELLRRARFVASGGDPATLVPLVALLEEMNGATNRLRAYWKGELEGKGMSPAITALGNLSSMGRELRMHILMAGQSMTAKAVGGPENRENFGGRALARATAAQWRILAPQIKPVPAARKVPGRWHLVVGDVLKEFQVPFCDLKNESARLIEWATSGGPVPDVPAMMAGLSSQVPTSANTKIPAGTTALGVSLSAYVAQRPGLTLAQLQKWSQRHADAFPGAVGTGEKNAKLYRPEDLDLFVLLRQG